MQLNAMKTISLSLFLAAIATAQSASPTKALSHFIHAVDDLDTTLADRGILLAWREDGAPLDARFGPLQLIVPGDKHPSRSEHQVVRLDVTLPLPRTH